MKKTFIKVTNYISIAAFFTLFFAATAASQSITFTTSKKVGETVQLLIKGSGTIEANGISEAITSGQKKSYTLTAQRVTLKGNISKLECTSNALTALDVSQCGTLEELTCYTNQLTSLDVSACASLSSLECWDNQLTSLLLPHKGALSYLDCGNNRLTELDPSDNEGIEYLLCYHNQLKTINLTGCTALAYLACQDNRLTCSAMEALVGALPTRTPEEEAVFDALTDKELTAQSGEGNILLTHAVEVATAKNWNVFSVGEDDKETEYTGREGSCSDFEPSTIILSTERAVGKQVTLSIQANGAVTAKGLVEPINTDGTSHAYTLSAQTITLQGNITKLICEGNQLTTLNVSQCKPLVALHCADNALQTIDVQQNTNLTLLDCARNALNALDISSCTNLKELYCGGNTLHALDVSACSLLETISCYSNRITALKVSSNTLLKHIACEDNLIGCEEMEQLATSLPKREASEKASLIALCDKEKKATTGKGNIVTEHIVAIASEKAWSILSAEVGGSDKQSPFTGRKGVCQDFSGARITFTTNKKVGEKIKMLIDADGPVTATGLKEPVKTDSTFTWYTLMAQTVTLSGDISKMNCSKLELTSLKTTQSPLLTTLLCQDNQLETLDVTQCENLTTLFCHNNKLTSLDLSYCPQLMYLACDDNQLSTLDITACRELKTLSCSSNQLTTFDISGREKLERFWCYGNMLEHLNVAQCPNLTSLMCYNNKLTSLDASHSTHLQYLYCYSNRLTSLNISDCKDLFWLSCEDNLLNCTAMEAIAEALTDRSTKETASIDVLIYAEETGDPSTGNVFTEHAANIAKSKNWSVYSVKQPGYGYGHPYAGRKGQCTDSELTFTVSVEPNAHGRITVSGADDLQKVAYGSKLKVSVSPDEKYVLDKLWANDEDITATKSFTAVSNVTIRASFRNPTATLQETALAIYPNPTSESVYWQGAAPYSTIRLYSLSGHLLASATSDSLGNGTLSVAAFSEGEYLFVLYENEEPSFTTKLTIKRK